MMPRKAQGLLDATPGSKLNHPHKAVSTVARHTAHKQSNSHKIQHHTHQQRIATPLTLTSNRKQSHTTANPDSVDQHGGSTDCKGGPPCRNTVTQTRATTNKPCANNENCHAVRRATRHQQYASNLPRIMHTPKCPHTQRIRSQLETHVPNTLGSLAAASGPTAICMSCLGRSWPPLATMLWLL